jgi:molecular chaperone GrpE
MSTEENKAQDAVTPAEETQNEETMNETGPTETAGADTAQTPDEEIVSEEEKAKREAAEWKDKYFRLYADFDNFRKRSVKERIDLLASASGDVLKDLLVVLDDFERAVKANESLEDIQAVKEGFGLIHHKLFKKLEAKGLKPIESTGKSFDVDFHEAITNIPAPSEDLKGKVVDTVETGYLLNEKVIRFAKVVVGA